MAQLDRARFSRVDKYLSSLPEGLKSYPQCRGTAALFRHFLDNKPLDKVPVGALPPDLQQLIEAKVPVSSWVDEVRVVAVLLAIADHYQMSDQAFVDFNHQMNREFLGGRFFRVLMAVASPALLLSGAPIRWNAVHQGSQLKLEKLGPGRARIFIEYPRHLYNELFVRCLATSFMAVLELCNAKDPRCELKEYGPERSAFEVQW